VVVNQRPGMPAERRGPPSRLLEAKQMPMNENVEPNRKPELEDTASVSPGRRAAMRKPRASSCIPGPRGRRIIPADRALRDPRAAGRRRHGLVYLAEQTAPFRRRVALKVIKLGMDTGGGGSVRRGASSPRPDEPPRHCRVFEAGATPDGRPYFVMEHVAGEPITSYCDRRSLTTKERSSCSSMSARRCSMHTRRRSSTGT